MSVRLDGTIIAILVADGHDAGDLATLRSTLRGTGGRVHLLAVSAGPVRASDGTTLDAQASFEEASPRYYDGIIVAGGAAGVRALSAQEGAERFLRRAVGDRRAIGASFSEEVLRLAGLLDPDLLQPAENTERIVGAERLARDTDAVALNEIVLVRKPDEEATAFIDRFAQAVSGLRQREYLDETSVESFPASDGVSGSMI